MKTEKLKQLCSKVLAPIIRDALHAELKDLNELIEAMGSALARIEERLQDLEQSELDDE